MNRVAPVCIFAGLLLVVVGLVFGLAFNYLVDHEARLVEYDAYQATFEAILQGDAAAQWQETLATTNRHALIHRRAIGVHTHGINMGIVLLLVGLLAPLLCGSEQRQSRLVVGGLIAAAWTYPLGLLVQFSGLTLVGQALAGLGAGLAIVALILLFWQMSRALHELRP